MDIHQTVESIARGTAEIINIDNLKEKLKSSHDSGKPLCIKAGFDPTAPDIHLGHVVLLRKLRQLQDFGHTVYFLIGDFTAQVGDPTGKDQLRKKMDPKEILANAKTYADQVYKFLDKKKTKVVFNSKWLAKLTSQQMLELTAHSTVAQMLARSDFKKRFEDNKEISMLEFLYPLLQGYDSVYLNADVELGGTDQKFNLLMGRQLQEIYEQDPQVVIMTPLLEGTDGVQKMSKSLDNYIGINEEPKDIFGKIMSINDELMVKYYECLTDSDLGAIKNLHPKDAKIQLGKIIVEQLYDKKQADLAQKDFENTFSAGNAPADMESISVQKVSENAQFVEFLVKNGHISSKREYHRLIEQGSISLDGDKILDANWTPKKGVLKIGKRRFVRLT